MNIQPYLFFDGRCEEALAFYKSAVGAEVSMLMRFKESPDPNSCAPGSENKVMHACFRIGDTTLFGSDGMNKGKPNFDGFALSVNVADEDEAEKAFKALGAGGAVTMPLTATFFAKSFGMLKDKFGVHWMVIAPKPT
ncbi:MAG: VOC family protein [Pseudolabrys sp.]|nr:VOC family protein [Pseudolabrys sp.]MBV9955464.1 VOC family protein [Pseudolabrys sp.]